MTCVIGSSDQIGLQQKMTVVRMIAELRFTNDYTLERFREFATFYKNEISVDIDDFDIVTIYTSFRLLWLRDSNLNIYCTFDFGSDICFDCQMDELSEIEF